MVEGARDPLCKFSHFVGIYLVPVVRPAQACPARGVGVRSAPGARGVDLAGDEVLHLRERLLTVYEEFNDQARSRR